MSGPRWPISRDRASRATVRCRRAAVKKFGILIGAGASVGAFDAPNLRPPLGADLYDALRAEYADSWGCLTPSLDSKFREADFGFEQGMNALWKEGGDQTQPALIDMSAYFTRFRIEEEVLPNRYFELTHLLQNICLGSTWFWGSLNYEVLLECTLLAMGYSPFYQGDHPDNGGPNPALVLKPHGSCNFVPAIGPVTFQGPMKMKGGHIWIDADLDVKDLDEVEAFCRTTGFPAGMSLYAEGKHSPVIWRALEAIRLQWQAEVQTADAMLIIGANPVPEKDPHVWRGIVEGNMPVALVGTCDDTFSENLAERLVVLGGHFETSIGAIREWVTELKISTYMETDSFSPVFGSLALTAGQSVLVDLSEHTEGDVTFALGEKVPGVLVGITDNGRLDVRLFRPLRGITNVGVMNDRLQVIALS